MKRTTQQPFKRNGLAQLIRKWNSIWLNVLLHSLALFTFGLQQLAQWKVVGGKASS